MDVQVVHGVKILSEEEAWFLFRDKAGTCVDDLSIAKEVMEECNGLPIALVTVARALRGENDRRIWEAALQQLRKANPTDVQNVIAKVYNPLKLSYDLLKNENAKSLFLLCSLFPEDDNISLEYLTLFAVGLDMFGGIRDLEDARDTTCLAIKWLKSRFLLLDGYDEYHVRMHDVVRDVSIFIASEKKYINCNDCAWISPSVDGRSKSPVELGSSNLRLLWTDNDAREEFQISESSIEGTGELKVLFITYSSLRSLPSLSHTTRLLKNLRTLFLYGCRSLVSISIVGELPNLEIFICRHCESIENLPVEMRRLARLKLLEFSDCGMLKTIAPGIISSLVGLEELKMLRSFDEWEAADDEGKERKNARLRELESLPKLTCLEIEVRDVTLAAEQLHLSPKIVKFDIAFRDGVEFVDARSDWASKQNLELKFERKMWLDLPREITLGDWTHDYVRRAQLIYLRGDVSNNWDLGKLHQNLRFLALRKCSKVRKLVNISKSSIHGRYGTTTVFPLLERLRLESLDSLEEICDIDAPIPEGSSNHFGNLNKLILECLPALKHLWKTSNIQNVRSIELFRCHSLPYLFLLSKRSVDCFRQQEELSVWGCRMMEQVFLWNEEENGKDIGQENRHVAIFPKLKRLMLRDLPNLTTFCKGIERTEFPLLSKFEIFGCPQLESLVSSSGGVNINHVDDDDCHSSHLFCQSKVSFHILKVLEVVGSELENVFCHIQIPIGIFTRLEHLKIGFCHNISSLFSSSMTENLGNLYQLQISHCRQMVKVIEDNEEEEHNDDQICVFPKLRKLTLAFLNKLECFCEWECALELAALEELDITVCPNMKVFTLGSLIIPNLKQNRIRSEYAGDDKDWINGLNNGAIDVNDLLQQQFNQS